MSNHLLQEYFLPVPLFKHHVALCSPLGKPAWRGPSDAWRAIREVHQGGERTRGLQSKPVKQVSERAGTNQNPVGNRTSNGITALMLPVLTSPKSHFNAHSFIDFLSTLRLTVSSVLLMCFGSFSRCCFAVPPCSSGADTFGSSGFTALVCSVKKGWRNHCNSSNLNWSSLEELEIYIFF